MTTKKFFGRATRFKPYLLIVSITALFGFGFLPTVFAQSGITIQPSLIEEKIEPGDIYSGTLQITNETNIEQTYYLSTKDIEGSSDVGQPIFAPFGEDTGLGIASWVILPKEPLMVGAAQTVPVDFSIKVPQDASPGAHLGGIFVGPKAERINEVGTGVGYQVVLIVNLLVAGDIVDEARVRSFTTNSFIYSKPKIMFTAKVENQGNIIVKPRGPLDITNMWGEKVASLVMNDSAGRIMPGEIRKFELEWVGEGLHFGRYEVVMSLSYGQEVKNTITRTVSFWVIPLNIILPILAVSLAIILGIYVAVKVHIKRSIRAIEQTTGKVSAGGTQTPMPRLTVISIVLIIFTILFLMGLFFFFA